MSTASLDFPNPGDPEDRTDLSFAYLGGADLSNANLSGADLSYAFLADAIMTGATVTGVTWNGTICPNGANSNDNGGTCAGTW